MEEDYVTAWLDGHYGCRFRVWFDGEPRSIRITCAAHWDGAGNNGREQDAVMVRDYDVNP